MYQAALKHFQQHDPLLHKVVLQLPKHHRELTPAAETDLLNSLCDAIISQQLSIKASATIFARFQKLFPRQKITVKKLLTFRVEELRAIGCSNAKAKYLLDLAANIESGKLNLKKLPDLPEEQVIAQLTQVKGIGQWTAEMFLIFALARLDVFSYGDLGLRKAVQRWYGCTDLPTQKEMAPLTEKWKPYRSFAARWLWKSLELET
jgi:DNA-3-methyladenine glycosylase II